MRSTYGGTLIALSIVWAGVLLLEVVTLVGGRDTRELSDWLYYGLMGTAAVAVLARAALRPRARLADNFGMQTVAEGVEDEATIMLLGEMGVDLVQGFHLGRPMPAEMATRIAGASGSAAIAEAVAE